MSLLFVLLLAQAVPAAAPAEPTEEGVAHMTAREIKAYNQGLAHNSPYYIRCVREAPTGSLVPGAATCRTNARWRAFQDAGNDKSRQQFEALQGAGFSSGH